MSTNRGNGMGDQEHDQAGKNKGILRVFKTYLDRRRLGELLVMTGLITPGQLRFALNQQKESKQPLGQIFRQHAMISRRQLAFVLGRQYMLRCVATTLFFMTASTSLSSKKAHADSLKDVPARISVSSISQEFGKVAAYNGLFGTAEKRSTNLKPFTKWTGMFAKFDSQVNNPKNSVAIAEWKENLEAFKGLPLKSMADKVNDLMNQKPYILDNKNWGTSDYWATPVEFLSRGGDCEDFAISKYTALRMLGVPEERMRIAIVHDNEKNIPHAVLVVYTDDGNYILDNQIKRLVSADGPGRYRPIFSINRTAWWMHTTPGATVVASAQ
jgi:predicted transglutaminase-like cysteine proteinase